jgi:hypothetical protein
LDHSLPHPHEDCIIQKSRKSMGTSCVYYNPYIHLDTLMWGHIFPFYFSSLCSCFLLLP